MVLGFRDYVRDGRSPPRSKWTATLGLRVTKIQVQLISLRLAVESEIVALRRLTSNGEPEA